MAIGRAAFNFADMRFTGQLQLNQPTSDGAGGQSDNFVTILTCRIYLEKIGGSDGYPQGVAEYVKRYTLKCRYQSAMGTLLAPVINPDTRWLINGEQYNINDFERVDMIPHFVTMTVVKNQTS